jgi:hypothetical protein
MLGRDGWTMPRAGTTNRRYIGITLREGPSYDEQVAILPKELFKEPRASTSQVGGGQVPFGSIFERQEPSRWKRFRNKSPCIAQFTSRLNVLK